MDNNFKTRQRKSFTLMRTIYGATISLLILGVSAVMFFGPRWNITAIMELDPLMRNLFGGLCLLYGAFRLYRSFKKEY